ncbi:MAG: DoxX family membrane protein [Armatimonadetes bacterium]|nr:DoxX family membrane protein [Armatimonadota bacterium]NIM23467.1 DoxX family membrane protein [Armatimonadota bacterium]NIM67333.1 DoxX family membrane protein [Armatimonadota bacterium]NIM75830.1 DoxX family membrane protein [Armatimonadota bacterium]NIN05518.1 DoxX family membrane protein [Armatimonadota bacterium]
MTLSFRGSRIASRILLHPIALVVARLTLAAVLLYAGIHKVSHTGELARIIYGYRLLHPELVNLVAMTLPWIELLTGATLLLGLLRRSGAVVACALFGVFILAAGLAMARGIDIPCGCFSVAATSERIGWGLIVRDVVFALLGAYLIFVPLRFAEIDSLLDRSSSR